MKKIKVLIREAKTADLWQDDREEIGQRDTWLKQIFKDLEQDLHDFRQYVKRARINGTYIPGIVEKSFLENQEDLKEIKRLMDSGEIEATHEKWWEDDSTEIEKQRVQDLLTKRERALRQAQHLGVVQREEEREGAFESNWLEN